MTSPISHILPFSNENQWSDLLAVFIEKDPVTFLKFLDLDEKSSVAIAVREGLTKRRDRTDLRILQGEILRAVIEVKVMSGISSAQLDRYEIDLPDAQNFVVVHFSQFEADTSKNLRWRRLTWEELLHSYSTSSNNWVSQAAAEWLEYIDTSLPKVDATTQWNDLKPGISYIGALRSRMAWVFGNLEPPGKINKVYAQSSAGASWIVKVCLDTVNPDYQVVVEIEESNTPRSWKEIDDLTPPKLKGPLVKVCLVQRGVKTSATFDWDYLLKLWRIMEPERPDWSQRSAAPVAEHDREAWHKMRDNGGPKSLGIGFGDRQARISNECMFGAKFQLPATTTLGNVVKTLEEMCPLLLRLAEVPRD